LCSLHDAVVQCAHRLVTQARNENTHTHSINKILLIKVGEQIIEEVAVRADCLQG